MKRFAFFLVSALLILGLSDVTVPQVDPQGVGEGGALLNARGKVTFLRVHDVGTGYGPPSDFIDVETVIGLDTEPGKAFGFQLRNDGQRPARQAMLDLLRDGFAGNFTVNIDYNIDPGEKNGVIIRVWITR